MKRSILLATAIIVTSFNPVLIGPALANPPIIDTTGMTPQQVCDAQLKPDERSDFTTYPTVTGSTDWVNDGAAYADQAIGDPEGYGTPVPSNVYLTSGFYRNGGSPNVWGGATATLTYPQTRQLYSFLQDQTRTTTFDCVVNKVVGSGSTIEPAGLQSTGNTTVESQTIAAPNDYVITDDDFVVYGQTVYALICISPNNVTKGKPGTWTQKNGFTGSCTDASTAAGTDFIPSGNAPIVD